MPDEFTDRRFRTYASFWLVGDSVDPDEITRRTGLASHRQRKQQPGQRSGPQTTLSGNRIYVHPAHWALHSRRLPGADAIQAGDLDAHLVLLLDLLDPRKDVIRAVTLQPDASADFRCFWGTYFSDGPTIQPETMVRMGALHASFSLDIYMRGE